MNCRECGAKVRDSARFCDRCGAKLHSGDASQWDICQVEEVYKRGKLFHPDLYGYRASVYGPKDWTTHVVAASRLVPSEERSAVLRDLTEKLVSEGWEYIGIAQDGTARRFRRLTRLGEQARS